VVTLEELPSMGVVFEAAKTSTQPVIIDSPDQHSGMVDAAYVSYNTPYATALHENLVRKKNGQEWEPRDWKKVGARTKKVKKGDGDLPGEGGPKWIEKALVLAKGTLHKIAESILEKYFQ
jgi:hypothetical protein